ncbi:MAG: hypothetical protein V2B19_30360 [Pseudomonadota bacterium]
MGEFGFELGGVLIELGKIASTETQKLWERHIAPYKQAPAGSAKPARSLSSSEARDVLVHLVVTGQLKLENPLSFDSVGHLKYPKAGERVRVKPAIIAGVDYVHADAGKVSRLGMLDPAFIVLLFRFAVALKKEWTATEIYYGGLGVGREANPDDAHNSGRAMDFWGASTGRGTFMVQRDWGSKRVPIANGKTVQHWPSNSTKTSLRLDENDPKNKLSRDFFSFCYKFLTKEARDSSKGPSKIGEKSFIVHPDHPDAGLRPAHQNHIHFQIGDT